MDNLNYNDLKEKSILKNWKHYLNIIIGSALGLGLSPIAPGTCGALLGIIIHLFIVLFFPVSLQIIALIFLLFIIIILNHILTPWAIKYWKSDDPSHFVLDEIAGYLIVPILFHQGKLWQIILWGFLLFRVFDIIKLPGARQIDRKMKNSWGIILDDLVSGLYAVIMMYILLWLGPRIGLEKYLFTN